MEIRVVFNHAAVDERFQTGFGWACLINGTVLFDTGSNPDILRHNLEQAGVAISRITDIILSHEHWDHIDGLPAVLSPGCGRRVHIPGCFSQEFQERIRAMGGEPVVADDVSEISSGIMCSRAFSFEYKGRAMGERMAVARCDQGLVVVTGCAHPGILEMVREARRMAPGIPIHAVIGGMHLREASPGQIGEVCAQFQMMGVSGVAPTHCSGELAADLFSKQYGRRVLKAEAGAVLIF